MEVMEAIGKVEEAAKVARPEVRRVERMAISEAARQGDIYLVRIPATAPKGAKREDHQLAPGTTQGSRHVATGDVEVFEASGVPKGSQIDERALLGPVIVASGRCLVTHPEHAHVDLPPGHYQVVHQMDARTRERVQD